MVGPHLAVQWILAIGAIAVQITGVLVTTMPEEQLYWKHMFLATIIQSFCPDFFCMEAQVVACNSVGKKDQGFAESLLGKLQLYATSTGLGFAGIVETRVAAHAVGAEGTANGNRAALYFRMALAASALVIGLAVVRMPKDTTGGWRNGDDASSAVTKRHQGAPSPA